MTEMYALFTVFSVLFGLVWGSFFNVAIARWPERRSVVAPRSACPACGTPIAAIDNIPIASWIALRGACRSCGWRIPVRYPLVEALGGLLGFLAFRRFVPGPLDLDAPHLAAACVYFAFLGALLIGALVDVRHRILPDQVTIYAIPAGVAGSVLLEQLGYVGWMSLGWKQSVLGAALGLLFFGSVAAIAQLVTGVEAFGWGDAKLLGMIGAFLGPHPAILVVAMGASLTGALLGLAVLLYLRRRPYLPFGPPMALWAALYLLYGDTWIPAFLPGLARGFPASFGM